MSARASIDDGEKKISVEQAMDRIHKLLDRADRTAGTPEGDACNQRAFELIAKYGVSEAQVRSTSSRGESVREEIASWTFEARGSYQRDQKMLVGALASALHCRPILSRGPDGKRALVVIGVRRHVERVELLAGPLCRHMFAAAMRQPKLPGVAQVSHRKSFMAGFASEVRRRLEAAEATAVRETGDSPGVSIALVSDEQRADDEVNRRFGTVGTARPRYLGLMGMEAGRKEAGLVDLGQRRFDGAQRRLTA